MSTGIEENAFFEEFCQKLREQAFNPLPYIIPLFLLFKKPINYGQRLAYGDSKTAKNKVLYAKNAPTSVGAFKLGAIF